MADAEVPTSYKDPFWVALADKAGDAEGLPKGLLPAIVSRGERSNADQVSSAGAKTPFQIIPATRKGAIDKYGIDPYLSPENAAEVAAKLLKDSLDRNSGNVPAAVAEYHGGTDRANWGPVTRSYVQRVTGSLPSPTTTPDTAADSPDADPGPSTFDTLWKKVNAPPVSQVANILKAYQSGAMAPADAKQFEDDVNAGHIMLPRGASLQAPAAASPSSVRPSSAMELPQGVVDAFQQGKLSPEEKTQLFADVAAGHVKPPPGVTISPDGPQIPGGDPMAPQPDAPTTVGQDVVGAGEAALSAGTGLVGLPAAILSEANDMSKGVANYLGRQLGVAGPDVPIGDVDANATAAGQAVTYQPRTPAGQRMAGQLGGAIENLTPLAAAAPELAALHAGAGPALTQVRAAAAPMVDAAGAAVARGAQAVREAPARVAEAVGVGAPAADAAAPAAAAAPLLDSTQLTDTARTAAAGGMGSTKATQALAQQTAPDAKVVASARRLGIEDYLQPDHVTTNQVYREFAQGVKSLPGSATRSAEIEGLQAVSKRASDLIDEIGGTQDLTELSGTVRGQLEAQQRTMGGQADRLWEEVRSEVPAGLKVQTPATTRALQQTINDMGGEALALKTLPPAATKFLRPMIEGDEVTHAYLDNARKQVGQAMQRGAGPFADLEQGQLKHLYGALSADQEAVTRQVGGKAYYAFQAAKYATRLQKGFEDDLSSLFGKDLDRSFVGGLRTAMTQASAGNPTGLQRLVSSVPPELRQNVVASGLGTMFRTAATRGDMDFSTFTKWYDGLRRNRQAYAAVMTNLPLSARKQIAALHRVSAGISAASRERITTGRIQAVQAQLQGADTLMSRIYDVAKRASAGAAAEVVTTPMGLPGVGLVSGLTSALMRTKAKPLQAADELISSPEFMRAVRAAANSADAARAAQQFAQSKAFADFARATGEPPALNDRQQFVVDALVNSTLAGAGTQRLPASGHGASRAP